MSIHIEDFINFCKTKILYIYIYILELVGYNSHMYSTNVANYALFYLK